MSKKILMVCLGNICRSPLAEGILRSKLPSDFFLDSAGTISYNEGKPADRRSIKVAKENGLDISKHRSRIITAGDLENFDVIYCMDLKNYEDVVSLSKNEEQRQKVFLLLEVAGEFGENIEVPDPYYGDIQDFENVYHLIDKACDVIAEKYKLK